MSVFLLENEISLRMNTLLKVLTHVNIPRSSNLLVGFFFAVYFLKILAIQLAVKEAKNLIYRVALGF